MHQQPVSRSKCHWKLWLRLTGHYGLLSMSEVIFITSAAALLDQKETGVFNWTTRISSNKWLQCPNSEARSCCFSNDTPRINWCLAVVKDTISGEDGLIRAANIRTYNSRTNKAVPSGQILHNIVLGGLCQIHKNMPKCVRRLIA